MPLRRALVPEKLVMVLAWLVATALAGTVTWAAVLRLGREDQAMAARPLSRSEVRARLGQASSATESPPALSRSAAPSPTATHPGIPARTTPTPPQVSRSWQLNGGTVGVTCGGGGIQLLYAIPLDGWAYRLEPRLPGVVSVEFTRAPKTVQLSARCHNGVPMRSAVPPGDTEGNDDGSGD